MELHHQTVLKNGKLFCRRPLVNRKLRHSYFHRKRDGSGETYAGGRHQRERGSCWSRTGPILKHIFQESEFIPEALESQFEPMFSFPCDLDLICVGNAEPTCLD